MVQDRRQVGAQPVAEGVDGVEPVVGQFGAGTAVDFLETGIFGKEQASLSLRAGPGGALEAVEGPRRWEQRIRLLDRPAAGSTRAGRMV